MYDDVQDVIQDHLAVVNTLLEDEVKQKIVECADKIRLALASGNKVMLCGNGGSAADCQHIAAEFVGRFQKERSGLPAIALTVDTSILTAVGNDYGYDKVFERQVEALAQQGDVLIGISTSGNSQNVVNAINIAKDKGAFCIGLTAIGGGKMADICDVCISISTPITARAQEAHILIGHILCQLVDE